MRKHNFFVQGSEYCFKSYGFTTQFHPEFISSLCDVPDLIDGLKKSTFGDHWSGIRQFLTFLATETPALFEILKFSESPLGCLHDEQVWTTTLLSYRDWLKIERKTNARANKSIASLNWWLKNLQSEKVIPEVDRVARFPQSKLQKRLKPSTIIDTHLPDHILEAIGADAGDQLDEIKRIYAHTRYEVNLLENKPDGFDSLPDHEQSRWVLETRLHDIRIGIEQQFLEAKRIRCEGLKTVRAHRHLVPLIDDLLSWRKGPLTGRNNPYVEDAKALGYETYRNALLSWFWYKNDKVQLKEKVDTSGAYRAAKRYFNQLRIAEGLPSPDYKWDDRWFAERIGCVERLIAPAALLLVFDYLANATSVYDIDNRPMSNEYGVPIIHWVKNRAHSALFKFLPAHISVSGDDVVKVLSHATRPYRRFLLEKHEIDNEYLFLNYHSSKEQKTGLLIPRRPEWNTFVDYTKAALSKVSEAEWTATSSQLRNSILLLVGMDGGVEAIKEEAQHSGEEGNKQVSTTYANKGLIQMQHDEAMREFKEWLQTIITLNIEDAASKLGVDPVEYSRRAEKQFRYRFGGLSCGNPKAGTQEGTKGGQTCNKIARCLFCPERRNVFIESVENLIHLLQWEEALIAGAEKGEIDPKSPNWYFWLAFIREMLFRITEDDIAGAKKKAMLAEAKKEAESRPNHYLNIDFAKVV